MRRRRATPPSSICIPRRASVTRWATSSPPYRNRTPLVITAGQQARSILPYDPFLYSAQATELPKPYVKWSCEPARAEDVPLAIARAYYIAMQPPRGPVLVSIPADDWAKPCEPVARARREHRDPARSARAGRDRRGARRVVAPRLRRRAPPSIATARGTTLCGLPSGTTRRCGSAPMSGRCSFPEDHALFAGFLPPMREKIVDLLAGHDVIFALGAAAFTYHVEGAGPHLPAGARLVQLIDDPQIAAWTPQGTSGGGQHPPRRARPARARRAARRASVRRRERPPPRIEPSSPMSAAFVMQTLAEIRDPASIVVEEAPSSRRAMQTHLPILRSETFYTMDSGGLGWAHAGGGGRRAGQAGREGHRPHRRRVEHVLDPGAVERRAARAADHVRHSQEPALRGAAGVRAGVRLRSGRAAAGHRAAGYRFRCARARPGLPRREREPRAGLARRARRCAAGIAFRRSWKSTLPEPSASVDHRSSTKEEASCRSPQPWTERDRVDRRLCAVRACGRAGVAGQAGQADRQLPARAASRTRSPARIAPGVSEIAQAAGRGRESAGRQRGDRRRRRRQVAAPTATRSSSRPAAR